MTDTAVFTSSIDNPVIFLKVRAILAHMKQDYVITLDSELRRHAPPF